jgi:hypothetical protein
MDLVTTLPGNDKDDSNMNMKVKSKAIPVTGHGGL